MVSPSAMNNPIRVFDFKQFGGKETRMIVDDDGLSDLVEILKTIQPGPDDKVSCGITVKLMEKQEFEALPEFDGK